MKKGQKDAEEWKDIVAVSVGPGYVAGLKMTARSGSRTNNQS